MSFRTGAILWVSKNGRENDFRLLEILLTLQQFAVSSPDGAVNSLGKYCTTDALATVLNIKLNENIFGRKRIISVVHTGRLLLFADTRRRGQ